MSLPGLDGLLLGTAVAALLAAAVLPLAASFVPGLPAPTRALLPRLLGTVGSLAAAVLGALAFAGGERTVLEWWPGFPSQPFTLAVDRLSAPFVLLIGLVSASAFAAGHEPHDGAGARARLALQAAFTLAMLAVASARHTLLFLFAWEGMTLLSALLVAHQAGHTRARGAVFSYLALSHVGTACVATALLTLSARVGGFGLDAIATAQAQSPPADSAFLVWLLTVGFTVKLGVLPLHVWLPRAHPEAPAPVSAALSGAMVPLGLYGLLRFAWESPGAPPAGWGTVLLIAGTATALAGALYAAVEDDAKRLLAWSTVKHSGVLTLATGLGALLLEAGRADLAGLALSAAFVHVVGHGLAKGAAFLGYGTVVHAVGARELDAMGGLARRMPDTAGAALLATLALAGLPLFSCFAGEWLLVQTLLLGYSAGAGELRLLAPFAIAGIALAGALGLAAMVKLYGIAFLGRARTPAAAQAVEAPARVTRALLVTSCLPLVAGVGAPWVAALLARPVAALLPGFDSAPLSRTAGLLLVPAGLAPSSVSPFLVLLLGTALALLAIRVLGPRSRTERTAPSWACGGTLEPDMQYSSHAFTRPLRVVFEPVLRPESEVESVGEGSPYHGRRVRHRAALPSRIERALYAPLVHALVTLATRLRRFQTGHLHLHLAWLLATLVALLLWGRHE